MKPNILVLRSLMYYWRTNVAVVLGVAAAVAVLAGALLVGDSVRGSLRDLVLQRLGRTDHIIASSGFVREQIAENLRAHPDFGLLFDGICPIIVADGFVTQQSGDGRAGDVRVYGVDDRFWQFHGIAMVSGLEGRDALISPALAKELAAEAGATILVRVQRPSDVPIESLHGQKEDVGRTLRAIVRDVVPREQLGEFSLEAQQGEVRAVFLPLALLQQDLNIGSRVNTFLVAAKPEGAAAAATDELGRLLRSEVGVEDLGLRVRVIESRPALSIETESGLLDDSKADAAMQTAADLGLQSQPVFTYLTNSLRSGGREIPYSLVTAMDLPSTSGPPPMVLNDWAARDLRVGIGDTVTMEYYVWVDPGRLLTRTMDFRVAGVVPIDTRDRDLAPVYPGISESLTLGDWDPPFPIDLGRIRRVDEEYWEMHRTTPKAFIPFAVGRELWQSRYGSMTSIRVTPASNQPLAAVQQEYAEQLRAKMDPLAMGIAVMAVRAESLEASRGATDFGEYFVYFSFFLVVSALLLAALFFKLSVEQRAREVGLLRAVGFRSAVVRRLFAREGLFLSMAGAAIGVFGGMGYASLMVSALGTWWVGAVGTTALTLHVSAVSLAGGAIGGIVAAIVCIWLTLRSLRNVSERSLLAGQLAVDNVEDNGRRRRLFMAAIGFAGAGAALIVGAAAGILESSGAFFGGGAAVLAACLCFLAFWFGRPARKAIDGRGWLPVSRLGLRNAAYRPARSVLSIAMIASATFILISVDAFRRQGAISSDPRSGVGGYSLLVESLLPLVHDPSSPEGRRTLGLAELDSSTVEPFRVRPGDDASCLNLYEPKNPRILALRASFINAGRFAFQSSLAQNDAERANPWLLLRRDEPDGAVPVVADANSMAYVLHRKLGEDIVIAIGDRQIRLRLVAALDDSIFQGELLMSEENFLQFFPEQEGYQFLLVETSADVNAVGSAIENALEDFGADATRTTDRLAQFRQVENTYLSTFQMLGGLGLLLGTVGLGAVLLRNVLERRRELALLSTLGYNYTHFFGLVIAENALLLVSGLLVGAFCALLAISPVLLSRGGGLSPLSLVALLFFVLATGLITSLVATVAALRSPLLPALRAE